MLTGRMLDVATSAVYHGDAFDLLADLPASSVDVLVTFPPYWGLRTYGLEHNDTIDTLWEHGPRPPGWRWYREQGGALGQEPYPEWYVQNIVDILLCAEPALKPAASVLLNVGDTYWARGSSLRDGGRQGLGTPDRARRHARAGGWRHEKQLLMIPSRVAVALQDAGWPVYDDVIWRKVGAAPQPARDRLVLAHEHLFHFSAAETTCGDGGGEVLAVRVSRGGEGHSATFPPELVSSRILACCPPGGLLVDPFCGTGTALRVAVEHDRRAVGFDDCADYAEVAAAKLLEVRSTRAA
jgi:DNA modification methylase